MKNIRAKIQVCLPTFPICSVIICKDPSVPTNISNVLSHYLQRSSCVYHYFQCLHSLSANIQVCLPTFPMCSVIICKDPGVPTNISNVLSHYLQRTRCAYQHFHCLQSLYPKIQVCLPTFLCLQSLSGKIQVCLPIFLVCSVIICKDPNAPTNISNVFSHYIQRSKCSYQHFQYVQSLSAKIQVCLPTFLVCSVIICKDPSVPTSISIVFSHYFQRSRCAYHHFQCVKSLSAKIQVFLPTFLVCSVIICKDPSVLTNISNVFSHYLQRSKCAYQHFQCVQSLSAKIKVCLPTFPLC